MVAFVSGRAAHLKDIVLSRWLGLFLMRSPMLLVGSSFLMGAAPPPPGNPLLYPTVEELVEVRSIGDLSVSPDGQSVAYRVLYPSVTENRTSAQWFILSLVPGATPKALGQRTDPLYVPMYDAIEDSEIVWAADSQAIFVRLPGEDGIQLHQLTVDGTDRQLTHDSADISAFEPSTDGSKLIYTVHNSRADIERLQSQEERRGIRIDRHVSTEGIRLSRNFRFGSRESTIRWSGIDGAAEAYLGAARTKSISLGETKAAEHQPRLLLDTSVEADRNATILIPGTGIQVGLRTGQQDQRFTVGATLHLTASFPNGTSKTCKLPICEGGSGIIKAIAVSSSTDVLIVREEDFSARSKVYFWNPVTGKEGLLFDAKGSLDGGSAYSARSCVGSPKGPICVFSSPTIAPRLVRISPGSNKTSLLVDPNSDFQRHKFGNPRFLEWKDQSGRSANGVLLLPDRQDGPVPLVITTYRCRGLLRGGVSNLAPEFPLVSAGIAALCVNNNNANILAPEVEEGSEPLYAHKAALESYRAIIAKLASQGLIDPKRVGIAGHSFSANVVSYGISHTDLFATAVIGDGITIDPATFMLTQPTVPSWRSGVLDFLGLPPPDKDPEGRWPSVSPALNAKHIRAPLLIQPPENEYLDGIQLFAAIQHAGGTVDMIVFPDEGHMVGRSPAHQYWRAVRSVAWFDFWLKGDLEKFPLPPEDRTHWTNLKGSADE